jgi:PGF-pre-PGF domain-containing protein
LSGSDKFIGENLTLGPEGAHLSPDIQIRFNYTPEILSAAGISASELRIKFYNTSSTTWVVQTPYTLNETGKYIIANVSHFSTYALLGTPTTSTTPTTSSGGSGGSGGGGVITAEPYDNIASSETYEKSLVYNIPVLYTFKLPEHGIYEIAVTGKENENTIALKVEALKGPTKIAGISAPPGTVYKNINIWSGSQRIKEALIRFKVENTWIANNNLASGDLLMVRWNGNEWTNLDVSELKKDDTYTFYEAKTEGFSSFAITAIKDGVVPEAAGVTEIAGTPVKPIGTETVTPMPTKNTPGFEAIITVFATAMLVALLRNNRQRR